MNKSTACYSFCVCIFATNVRMSKILALPFIILSANVIKYLSRHLELGSWGPHNASNRPYTVHFNCRWFSINWSPRISMVGSRAPWLYLPGDVGFPPVTGLVDPDFFRPKAANRKTRQITPQTAADHAADRAKLRPSPAAKHGGVLASVGNWRPIVWAIGGGRSGYVW